MYTISDRGRALCVLSAEHEALQQQAKNITAELMHHMQRLSNEHKTILQKNGRTRKTSCYTLKPSNVRVS